MRIVVVTLSVIVSLSALAFAQLSERAAWASRTSGCTWTVS